MYNHNITIKNNFWLIVLNKYTAFSQSSKLTCLVVQLKLSPKTFFKKQFAPLSNVQCCSWLTEGGISVVGCCVVGCCVVGAFVVGCCVVGGCVVDACVVAPTN